MQYIKKLSEVINDVKCMNINSNIDFSCITQNKSFGNGEVDIVNHRCDRNQKIHYKIIKPNGRFTYIPESNFSNCSEDIINYWNSSSREEPNKIFIYCRISSVNQNDIQNGHASLITQEINCREYANRANVPVCGVIKEIHSARTIKHQSSLMKLIDCLSVNNLLLVWNVSRFSRDTIGGQNMIEKIQNKGASIYFMDDDIVIEPNCRPIVMHKFRELLSHSKLESDIISWRVKGQKNIQVSKGSYLGGKAPYGYALRIENGVRKFIEVEEEQEAIKSIKCGIEKHKRKRKYNEIAEQFNTANFKKRGKIWTKNSVRHIYLKNYKDRYKHLM